MKTLTQISNHRKRLYTLQNLALMKMNRANDKFNFKSYDNLKVKLSLLILRNKKRFSILNDLENTIFASYKNNTSSFSVYVVECVSLSSHACNDCKTKNKIKGNEKMTDVEREYYRKRIKQNTTNEFTLFKRSSIEFYADYCEYSSPNIYCVVFNPDLIFFKTRRFVGSDPVDGISFFDLDGNPLKINNYEKNFLNEESLIKLASSTFKITDLI